MGVKTPKGSALLLEPPLPRLARECVCGCLASLPAHISRHLFLADKLGSTLSHLWL